MNLIIDICIVVILILLNRNLAIATSTIAEQKKRIKKLELVLEIKTMNDELEKDDTI